MPEITQFISKDAEKQIKDLVKLMADLAKSYEQAFKSSKKLDEQITKISKSTDTTAKKKEQLTDIEKEEARILKATATTQAKLEKVRKGATKILDQEQEKLKALNKQRREEAKEIAGVLSPYQKLNKRRAEAKNILRDLQAGQKASNEEIEKATKNFEELDSQVKTIDNSVKDFSKDVGGYEDAIRNATEGNEAFSGGATNVLQNFISLNQQEGGVKSFFKSFVGGIVSATKAGLRFIATPIGAVIAAIVAGIAAITAVLSRNESASDKFNEVWKAATAILDVVAGRIIKLITAFGKFISGDFEGAANDASDAFSNLGDAILEAGRRGVAIARLTVEVEKLNTILKVTESSLDAQIRKFDILADDATRSFKERENAAQESRKLNSLLAKERETVARKELELVNAQVKQAIAAGTINRALRDQEADAISKFIQVQGEAMAVELENEKTRRELVQDRLERDLDILIDGFDNVKTINERIIGDDRKTFEERAKLFNETIGLSKKSFDAQIGIIKEFTKVSFDENALIAEQDAVVLNEKIRQLGLSEIIEGRLLEIIRDRRTAVQDLVEVQRDLTNELLAEFGTFEKIQRDQIVGLNDDIIESNEKVTDKYLDELDKRIKATAAANEEQEEETVKILDKIKEKLEEVFGKEYAQIIGGAVELGLEIFRGFQETRKQQLSDESTALELQRQTALEGVEGQKNKEAQINAQFDKKQAVIKQKQWKAEQDAAISQIIIQGLLGAAKTLGNVGLPAAIPLLILQAGLIIAQIAFVKAQKPPKFAKGSKGLQKDTYAEVGDAGRELLFMPGGGVALAEQSTKAVFPKGTVIKTNKETNQILAANQLRASRENDVMARDYSELRLLGQSIAEDKKSILKAVKDRDQYIFEVSKEGVKALMKNSRGTTTYLDNRFR